MKNLLGRTRLTTGVRNGLNNVQKRYIALYRTTHTPWAHYELTNQPELAKECEELVAEAYKNGNVEEAKVYFHRYRSLGVLPTTRTWHKILLLAYKEGDYNEIQSLIHELMIFGVQIDNTAWNFLIDIVSKRGLVRKTEETFWSAITHLQGEINEFTMRSYFNCLMQEKRYARAIIAYAGMVEYGFKVTDEERSTLEEFAKKRISELPGGLQPMANVPQEDLELVQNALRLDELTFSHSNLLSASDNLTPAGRNAVLTWYAMRATNISSTEAFNILVKQARQAWNNSFSKALRIDGTKYSLLNSWMSATSDETLTLEPSVAEAIDHQLQKGPFEVGSFAFSEAPKYKFLISKGAKGYERSVVAGEGTPIPIDEATFYNQNIRKIKPHILLRSHTL